MDTNKLILYGPTGTLIVTNDQWDFIQTIPGLSTEKYKAVKEAATKTVEVPPIVVVPPVDPPKVDPPPIQVVKDLKLLTPVYDEKTRALTFRTEGGTGGQIAYEMPGVTSKTLRSVVYVDEGPAKDRKDIYKITAIQDGKQTDPVWFSMASYTLVDDPKKGTTTETPPITKPNDKPTIPIVDKPTTQPVNAEDETNEIPVGNFENNEGRS